MMTTADMRRAALLNDSVQDVRDCESRAVPAASPGRRRHCHCAAAWLGMMLALAGCTTVGPDFVQPKAPVLGAMAGGRQDGRHAKACGADPVVGSLPRSGAQQADRDRLPEQLQPEDRGPAGAAGAGPAGDRRGLPLPAGPAGERQRELYVGQQECRQHEGRGPGILGIQRRRQRRLGARFLGQIPALDRGSRRQSAGLRRRL